MCVEKYADLNSHLVLLAAKVGIILQTAAKIVNYFLLIIIIQHLYK